MPDQRADGSSAGWAAVEVAKALIHRHGIGAEEEARRRAADLKAQDDHQGASAWIKVADIIRKGLSGISPSG
jgi:hypothetical protein